MHLYGKRLFQLEGPHDAELFLREAARGALETSGRENAWACQMLEDWAECRKKMRPKRRDRKMQKPNEYCSCGSGLKFKKCCKRRKKNGPNK